MIKSIANISKILRRPQLNRSLMRNGEKVSHSFNPFVGDSFVSNGQKLANGPRTFFRQLKKSGFEDYESSRLLRQIDSKPDLYTVFSRELHQISEQSLSNANIRRVVLDDFQTMSTYFEQDPNLILSLKGYGNFLNTVASNNIYLRSSEFLEKGISDFDTAEHLLSAIKKHSNVQEIYSLVPEIIKSTKLPKDELCPLFENCLKLVNPSYALDMSRNFQYSFFPKKEKNVQALIESLRTLTSKLPEETSFTTKEIQSFIKSLRKPYQVDFITNLNSLKSSKIGDWIGYVKNEEQANAVLDILKGSKSGKYSISEPSLRDLFSYRTIENSYQLDLIKMMNSSSARIGGKSISESISRFSQNAQLDILQNVKTETDYNIVKSMIERTLPDGKPVYHCEAILKVLEQNPKTKAEVLNRLNSQAKINEEAYFNTLESSSHIKNQIPQPSFMQKEIRTLSSSLSSRELLQNIKVGEVAQVGEKLFVNTGENLVELKISKDVFRELFMSETSITQGFLGDCGFVASIDAIMSMPKGRAAVYRLFEQLPGSKDIIISLENSSKIIFPNGEFKQASLGEGMHPITPKGLRMLEQAIAATMNPLHKTLKPQITMYSDFNPSDKNVMSQAIEGIFPTSVFSRIFKKGSYRTEIFSGYSLNLKNRVRDANSEQNSILIYGTEPDSKFGTIFPNIRERHYHNVKKVNPDMSLRLTNPHNTSFYSTVPFYESTNPEIMQILQKLELF